MDRITTVCDLDKCCGCMACIEICPCQAIRIVDECSKYNAVINERCIGCNLCHNVCQVNNQPVLVKPISWHQGWAGDSFRKTSSSGGVASSIITKFVSSNGIVCSCVFDNGAFIFKICDSLEALPKYSGSKYVKSNPYGIYKQIKAYVNTKRVLFIGLPCQVAALKNYLGRDLCKNLYTIDLICHGTPSPILLSKALLEYGFDLQFAKDVSFRSKDKFILSSDGNNVVPIGVLDRYMIAFLFGLSYTNNCYSCRYACEERIGDLTIGDSWGSELDEKERINGISLILCQNKKGNELLDLAALQLFPVNKEKAINSNHQLSHPADKPEFYENFFNDLSKGCKFKNAVRKYYFKKCIKQDIKTIAFAFRDKFIH